MKRAANTRIVRKAFQAKVWALTSSKSKSRNFIACEGSERDSSTEIVSVTADGLDFFGGVSSGLIVLVELHKSL